MVFLSFRRRVHLKHLRILLCWLAKDLISYQWNSVKSLTWPTCFGWEFLFTWTIFVLFETLPLENLISVGSFLIHFHLYGVFYFLEGLSFFFDTLSLEPLISVGRFLSQHLNDFRLVWNPSTESAPFVWEVRFDFHPRRFHLFEVSKTVWSQG